MKRIALALAASLFTAVAFAQVLADGEIRKIDKAAGKVTIKHGEIRSVGMAPMTMVFVVKDKAVLDTLAVSDKVKFDVKEEGGNYVVTKIEKAK
jgi:Cu(I)/Ag(I) efflux system periplasmic protein CusF